MNESFHNRAAGVIAFLVAVGVFTAGVWWYGYGAALGELDRRARSDLALASASLTGELKRVRELAVLTADHPGLLPLIAGQTGQQTVEPLLLEIADKTGALGIILVDVTGRELASTREFALRNHAQKPYFERAMDGALGVHHQLSEAYGRRVFIFAAPVFSDEGPVIAAILVVTDIEGVEATWRGGSPAVFFTDTDGIVFISNRSGLVMQPREAPFVVGEQTYVRGHEVWRVEGERYLPRRALHSTLALPIIGMTGEVLLDVAPARQLALLQSAVAATLCLFFGAVIFLATERRRTLARLNAQLEMRVANRTQALSDLNNDLRHEVQVRTQAEARLTKAQADLVQAGKLSALGQMSAGISHELNQPLMAIRSFAENAQGFLERDKPEVTAQNLGRISELARRMGRIIQNLRAFARQESVPLQDVDIAAVIDAAVELVGAKARDAEVQIIWEPCDPVFVRGGEVRLQQVVVNLISNAIDAMESSVKKKVSITVQHGARVTVSVRDTGPGITAPEKIFEPFYTTKSVGSAEGMGLGLSISYGLVQSFGGAIRGRNHADGGAVFTVELDAAHQEEPV